MNNLKQIGTALAMYHDNYGYRVQSTSYNWAFLETLYDTGYVKNWSIFKCPSDARKQTFTRQNGLKSYGCTYDNYNAPEIEYVPEPMPSNYVYVIECNTNSLYTEPFRNYARAGNWAALESYRVNMLGRHNNGSNVLFYDYHIEWVPFEKFVSEACKTLATGGGGLYCGGFWSLSRLDD
ncbi:MAG: hypothetical protein NC831_08070 [Candidatus Omnitrophica bacterium]|nr:hypothetical protein [Candidatus Omnitrophota bacterium]MCM8828528.1 hypothetical protein [Candidatus Omnitrophota bacterium]